MNSRYPRINKVVLQRAVIRGASIGLAAVLSGAIHKEQHAPSYSLEVGLVTGISSGLWVPVDIRGTYLTAVAGNKTGSSTRAGLESPDESGEYCSAADHGAGQFPIAEAPLYD